MERKWKIFKFSCHRVEYGWMDGWMGSTLSILIEKWSVMAGESRKRCLYEVLGVSRDSSHEEIRSAYKRLALQLHPDKVAASASDATAAFQELLHAYEVLSDPKERAWYDSHRSQILFADSSLGSKSSAGSFFDFDLFAFFSNSAFSGFSDSGKGFYKVYGDLFAKVYAQELRFAKELGLAANAVPPAPLIGNLESPYTQVTAFYNYWLGFSTVLDFAWVDEFDSSMGPNRRSRRLMEEENKKLRKNARREYNEAVRGLAAFVKKRDKRVVDMMMKRKQDEEKRREEEKARKREEERKKMERVRLYEEPDWAKIDQEDDELDEFENNQDDDSGKQKAKEELFCVVCNKKFNSVKQWKNHEQSKKHRDKVAELKMTFQEEDAQVLDEEEHDKGVQVGFDYQALVSEGSDDINELFEELEEDLELQDDDDAKGGNMEEKDDEASILELMISGRKNRKKSFLSQPESSSSSDHHLDNDEEIASDNNSQRRGNRNRASRKGTRENEAETAREEKSETQGDDLEPSKQCFSADDNFESSCNKVEEISKTSKVDQPKKHKPKKQQVDVKGTAKNAIAGDLKKSSKGRKQKAISNSCETCGECFDTRNKLFAHLGDTGHSTLKSR